MKLTVRHCSLVLVFIFFFIACDDEDNISITNEEAAEQVSAVISSDIVGLTGNIGSLVQSSESQAGRIATCGVTYDTTVTFSYEGTFISLDFEATHNYGLNCEGIIPTELFTNFTTSTGYEGPNVITSGSATGNLTATGLLASEYTANGTFTRTGTLEQKRGAQNSFSSTSEVTLSSLTISKDSGEITGGTLSLSVTGTSTLSGAFQFNANATFNEDGTVTTTINEGTQYLIDIESGEITEL